MEDKIDSLEIADAIFELVSAIREVNNTHHMREKDTIVNALLDKLEETICPSLLMELKSTQQSLRERCTGACMKSPLQNHDKHFQPDKD